MVTSDQTNMTKTTTNVDKALDLALQKITEVEVPQGKKRGEPEIYRNRGERGYRFKQAEAKAQARQAIRSKPRKLTVPTRSKIEAKLRQMRWSPEQISGWLSEQGIKLSHERIYQMIWDDKRDGEQAVAQSSATRKTLQQACRQERRTRPDPQ